MGFEILLLPKFLFLKSILTNQQMQLTIKRLANQVLESHMPLTDTVVIGIQPRGIALSDRIVQEMQTEADFFNIPYGKLAWATLPFFLPLIGALVLITVFPQITLVLPDLVYGPSR